MRALRPTVHDRIRLRRAVLALAALLLPAAAPAQSITASPAGVTIQVTAGGGAGQQPPAVTESSGRLSCQTLQLATWRIRARLGSTLPSGVTLRVRVEPVAPAVSSGEITLSTTDADVVTNIGTGANCNNFVVTYRLVATAGAGVIASTPATIVYTFGP